MKRVLALFALVPAPVFAQTPAPAPTPAPPPAEPDAEPPPPPSPPASQPAVPGASPAEPPPLGEPTPAPQPASPGASPAEPPRESPARSQPPQSGPGTASPPPPEPPAARGPAPAPADAGYRPLGPQTESPSRGFFARVAIGPGLFHASSGSSADTRRFSGGSASLQLMVGATPAPGFVLGGAYFRDQMFAVSTDDDVIDGDEPNVDDVRFALDRVGVFVDLYPAVDEGIHFQGFIGAGTLNTSRPGDVDDPTGVIASIGGGWEWLIGDHARAGALLRLTYGALDVEETFGGGTDVTVIYPVALATLTYH